VVSAGAPSKLEPEPVRRWLFRIPVLSPRIVGLLTRTPGVQLSFEEAPGVSVEFGYRHPLSLSACALFDPEGLTLFLGPTERSGASNSPFVVEQLPVLANLHDLFQPRTEDLAVVPADSATLMPPTPIGVPLRVAVSTGAAARPRAARLVGAELEQLRRLAYVLGRDAVRTTRVAMTEWGLFLVAAPDAGFLVLGELFFSPHPRLFLPMGCRFMPQVAPELVLTALGGDDGTLYFFERDQRVVGLKESGFVTLEHALLQPTVWVPTEASEFAQQLDIQLPNLGLGRLPLRPLERAR
jgi:hypothetical protein